MSTFIVLAFCNNLQCTCSASDVCIYVGPTTKPLDEKTRTELLSCKIPGAKIVVHQYQAQDETGIYFYFRILLYFGRVNGIYTPDPHLPLSSLTSVILTWLGIWRCALVTDLRKSRILE